MLFNKRRMLAVVFTSLIAGSALTACGGASADTSSDQENQSKSESVQLSMYIPGTGEADSEAYTQIIENLKETVPNVSADITQIGWDEYFTKLNVAFSGGTAPDLYGVGLGQIGPVQDAGNMLELNPYLEDWDGFEDIPQNVLDIASRDGKLYGNPMLEMRVLYYRKDLFEQAGLTQPPQSIEELEEYARKLVQTEDGKIKVSGLDIGTGEQTLFTVMLMFGADHLWNEDLSSAMLDDNAQEALTWCQNIMLEGLSDHTIMHNIQGGLFENGFAAMSLDGSSGITTITGKLGAENVGVAPLPTEKYMSGVTCWSVYSKTKHPEEAVALWKEIASKEGQLIIAEKVGFVPTRQSAHDEYIAMNPEVNEVFFNAAENAAPYGVLNPYFFEFVNNIRPLIDEVYYGNKTPEEAMTEFNQKYEAAISETDKE